MRFITDYNGTLCMAITILREINKRLNLRTGENYEGIYIKCRRLWIFRLRY